MQKKLFTISLIALAISGMNAQDILIHKTDGVIITVPMNAIDSITFTSGGTGGQGQPCPGTPTITDIDGNVYNTVLIGEQCWMKENLKAGIRINGFENQTNNGIIEKYCYGNDLSNCDNFGGLYQWDEMMQYITSPGVQGICPLGWHLPTNEEWTNLTDYVSGQPAYLCNDDPSFIAKALADKSIWNSSTYITCAIGNNLSANNATFFSGRPGGNRNLYGDFYFLSYGGLWWSSTESPSSSAWCRTMEASEAIVDLGRTSKVLGLSVRCLRD